MNGLEVTNVALYPMKGTSALKAIADVQLNSTITLKGFKVFEGKDGFFVQPPQETGKDGKYYNRISWTDEVQESNFLFEAVLNAFTGGKSNSPKSAPAAKGAPSSKLPPRKTSQQAW
jgi:DNA-binding cell septation regulator SpoVG